MPETEMDKREITYNSLAKADEHFTVARKFRSHNEAINSGAYGKKKKLALEELAVEPLAHGDRTISGENLGEYSLQEQEDIVNLAFEKGKMRNAKAVISALIKDADEVLKKDEVYDSKLKSLYNQKEILENIAQGDRQLLEAHGAVESLKGIEKIVKGGKLPAGVDPQQLEELASAGAQDLKYFELLKEGKGEDYAKVVSKLAGYIGKKSVSPEFVAAGVKSRLAKAKSDLKRVAGEDYEAKIAEIVAGALVRLAKSGDEKDEMLAVDLLHYANNGRSLGQEKPQKLNDTIEYKESPVIGRIKKYSEAA